MAILVKKGVFTKVHPPCGSLIEFSLSELQVDHSSDYLGDRDYYRFLICPGCLGQFRFPMYGKIN